MAHFYDLVWPMVNCTMYIVLALSLRILQSSMSNTGQLLFREFSPCVCMFYQFVTFDLMEKCATNKRKIMLSSKFLYHTMNMNSNFI